MAQNLYLVKKSCFIKSDYRMTFKEIFSDERSYYFVMLEEKQRIFIASLLIKLKLWTLKIFVI